MSEQSKNHEGKQATPASSPSPTPPVHPSDDPKKHQVERDREVDQTQAAMLRLGYQALLQLGSRDAAPLRSWLGKEGALVVAVHRQNKEKSSTLSAEEHRAAITPPRSAGSLPRQNNQRR
jgi:hypothetical protein